MRTLRFVGVAFVVWFAVRAAAATATASLLDPGARDAHVFQSAEPARANALRPTTTPPRRATSEEVLEALESRNMFCPDCNAESASPLPTPDLRVLSGDGQLLGMRLSAHEQRTERPLALLATMEFPARGAEHSLCTVEHVETGRVGVFGQNDPILPGVELALVDRGLIHLRSAEGYEYLPLRQPETKRKNKRRKTKKKEKKEKKKKRRKYEIPGADDAIACSGKTCTIERAFVEKLLAKPSLLARQAKVRPKAKDGDMLGFRLYRVRRKSLPRLLQLRSGDLLTSVNGRELDSMDAAMKMYRELRHASHLTLEVERRGKTLQMQYAIQ